MLVPKQFPSVIRQNGVQPQALSNVGLFTSQPPCADGYTRCDGAHNSVCCNDDSEICYKDPHDNLTAKCWHV